MHFETPLLLLLAALSEAKKCTTLLSRNPPPAGLTCGSSGKLEAPAVLKRFPHQSSKQGLPCINACFATQGCMSLSAEPFNNTVVDCILYSKPVADMALNTSAPDRDLTSFIDLGCFKCVHCNLQTQAPKITDGTFDDSTTSIAPWVYGSASGAQYALVPGEAGDGNAFSVALTSVGTTEVAHLSQKVPICAQTGKYFQYSFDYAFGSLDPNFVSYIDTKFLSNSETIAPSDTAWHSFSTLVYWDPQPPTFSFIFVNGGINQTFFIDNVVLAPQ